VQDVTADVSAALDRVLQRFAGMVRAIGARHRLSASDLDEVMQDVRIRLWRARSSREQIEALPTSYIYRTTVAAAVDLMRRRRRGGAAGVEEVDTLDAASEVAARQDAMSDVEQREGVERIMAAVDALPEARRAVVRMHLMGYERDEIVALLGWTDGKTRNLLYRGLADLRELLGGQATSPE
jgi:RNA polymerase sigma factor (sigma-70 family)